MRVDAPVNSAPLWQLTHGRFAGEDRQSELFLRGELRLVAGGVAVERALSSEISVDS